MSLNFEEVYLENQKLLIQPFPVTCGEFQKFLNISDQVEKERFKSDNPEQPVTGVNFFDAVYYANYISELQGFAPAYSIQEIPYRVIPTGDQGFRLFAYSEWKRIIDLNINDRIQGLKGMIWQWTETSESYPWDERGQTDPERPEYQWIYQIMVGGSNVSSPQFLQGYPTGLMLPERSYPRLGFRLVQGSRGA